MGTKRGSQGLGECVRLWGCGEFISEAENSIHLLGALVGFQKDLPALSLLRREPRMVTGHVVLRDTFEFLSNTHSFGQSFPGES